MTGTESFDAVIVGSGFGGAITAFHLAIGGARVLMLERGPRLSTEEIEQNFQFGSSATRAFDFTAGDGMSVLGGNCVGGGSVVYFAAMPRAPRFIFDRRGSVGRRLWPEQITRATLDPWYDRVADALPVSTHGWDDVSYPGGLWASLCNHSGLTANPLPSAVDAKRCTNCNWMMSGCKEDAKRSLNLNYVPAAEAYGAQVRPLHEVQSISRTADGYSVHYTVVDAVDYREHVDSGTVDAKVVILAAGAGATPVILQRSTELGAIPDAVGRYFSGNGERINVAVMDEARIGAVLGLDGAGVAGRPYEGFQVGRGPVVSTWDRLDAALPEFERFAVEQLYFPPGLGTILAESHAEAGPGWFGLGKKDMLSHWKSWLMLFSLIEDDNEGEFGAPPPTGNSVRLSQQLLGRGTLRYRPRESTRRAWAESDAFIKQIVERDGLGVVTPWTNDLVGAYTVHPLSSCRVGDDPATSALTPDHQLRGHDGIFVTDGSAVPTALTVNPSNTIAALAERAVPGIVEALQRRGVDVRYLGKLPT